MVQQIKYVLRNFRLQNDDKTLLCDKGDMYVHMLCPMSTVTASSRHDSYEVK
jgi:hypothetical protein